MTNLIIVTFIYRWKLILSYDMQQNWKKKLEKRQFVTKCLHSKKGLPTVCVEYNVSWFICNVYSQGQDGFKKFKLKLFLSFIFFVEGEWLMKYSLYKKYFLNLIQEISWSVNEF